jgi:hypothetical protein
MSACGKAVRREGRYFCEMGIEAARRFLGRGRLAEIDETHAFHEDLLREVHVLSVSQWLMIFGGTVVRGDRGRE